MSLNDTILQFTFNGSEILAKAGTNVIFPNLQPLINKLITLTDGTGANKAQKIGAVDFSILAAASQTLDLTAFGGPFANVNFSLVKFLIAWHNGSASGDIIDIGNDGVISNAWSAPWLGTSPRSRINTGWPVILGAPTAGFTVDGTHKNFALKNNGTGTLTGSVIVIGEGT